MFSRAKTRVFLTNTFSIVLIVRVGDQFIFYVHFYLENNFFIQCCIQYMSNYIIDQPYMIVDLHCKLRLFTLTGRI